MGLQKSITTASAVSADYHKIDFVKGSTLGENTFLLVKVGLYKSKTERDAGAAAVQTDRHSVLVDYSSATPILEQVYNGLKNLEYFAGALDV